MATEHFCLRWNNHQSTLVSVFDNLLESGTLVDCTLAADGRYLKAHKVVLSACSPYLSMLLSQHYDKHPIIILKDVKFEELKAMLDYMYRGEVNISQEQLSTFLKAAESLQIKGLTDTGGDEGNGLQPNRPPSSNSTTSIPNEDPQSPGPPGDGGSSPSPRKRKRNKHSDEPPDNNSQVKLAANDGSEWSAREGGSVSGTPTNTGSPSAMKNANLGGVKREPTDVDGDGQMSVDESSDSTVLARPGPSNGSGTNNKGSPWILSADSTGEEMQLTPGQDGGHKTEERTSVEELEIKQEMPSEETVKSEEPTSQELQPECEQPPKKLNKEQRECNVPKIKSVCPSSRSNQFSENIKINNLEIYSSNNEEELIIPDLIETSSHSTKKQCLEPQRVRLRVVHPNKLRAFRHSNESRSVVMKNKTETSDQQTHPTAMKQVLSNDSEDCLILDDSETLTNKVLESMPTKDSEPTTTKEPVSNKQLQSTSCETVSNSTITGDDQDSRRITRCSAWPSSVVSTSSITCSQYTQVQSANTVSKSKTLDVTQAIKCKRKQIDLSVAKFRKILPSPGEKKDISRTNTNEQEPNVAGGQYISFTTAGQSNTSLPNQQIQNNLSLPIQPQFTISPSQIQGGHIAQTSSSISVSQPIISSTNQPVLSNQLSLPIQPQFALSTSPLQNGNIQMTGLMQQQYSTTTSVDQSINNQGIVINQPGQPFSMSQPVFVTSMPAPDTSPQFITPTMIPQNKVFFIKTAAGFVETTNCQFLGPRDPHSNCIRPLAQRTVPHQKKADSFKPNILSRKDNKVTSTVKDSTNIGQ